MKLLLTLLCLIILPISTARAALTIDIVESGGDVVATASGSVDTSSLTSCCGVQTTFGGYLSGPLGSSDFTGYIILGDPGNVKWYLLPTPVVFSTGDNVFATTDSGDPMALQLFNAGQDALAVPSDYVSESPLASTATWSGNTIANLGLIPGTYVINWGSGASADSLTLNIGVSPPACTLYSDRAAFEAAAPGLAMEDFAGTTAGSFNGPLNASTNLPPYVTPGEILPGVEFSSDGFGSGLWLFDTDQGGMVPDGVSLSNSNDADGLAVEFNPAVSAFGLDLFSESDSVSARIYDAGANLLGSYDGGTAETGEFLGCISSVPVASVVINAPTADSSGQYEAIDNISFGEPSAAPISYSVSVTVTGLAGSGLALQNNGADTLAVASNGGYTFATALADSSPYLVTVSSQPAGETCSVSNDSGTIASADVLDVAVTCVTDPLPTYSVGGSISGLFGGVILQNNGADDLDRSSNGSFSFATELLASSPYAVTVSGHPTGQTCSVTNGGGTIGSAAIIDVVVLCVDNPAPTYSVGGTITGLVGSLILQNKGSDDLVRSANGSFAFATAMVTGSSYAVSVSSQPAGQACAVSNATGSVAGANVATVTVICATEGPVDLVTSFTATLPSGAMGTLSFTTPDPDCTFSGTPQFVPVASVTPSAPGSLAFIDGLVEFSIDSCTPGATVAITLDYGSAVPAAATYWKAGSPWFQLPTQVSGNVVQFSITDGGLGDADGLVNGQIIDPGGAAITSVGPAAAPPANIPTMANWGLLLLSMLLGAVVYSRREKFS